MAASQNLRFCLCREIQLVLFKRCEDAQTALQSPGVVVGNIILNHIHQGFPAGRPGVKFCVSDFRQKSRMALENRANSGLNPLITESHVGQNGMRAGTA